MEVIIWLSAVLANLLFWGFMFGVQQWDLKSGKIPPRSRDFLHMQDFQTNGILGDLIGLSLMNAGVAGIWYRGEDVLLWFLGLALSIGLVATYVFYKGAATTDHKPDWGYLTGGKITRGGRVHLFYLWCQSSIGILGIVLIWYNVGEILLSELIGLGGVAIYVIALILDLQAERLFAKQKED